MVSRKALERSFLPIVMLAVLSGPAAAGELLPAFPHVTTGDDAVPNFLPELARLSGGKFVVAWYAGTVTPGVDLVVRVFDASGVPQTAVTTVATGPQVPVSIAAAPAGNAFVVAWRDIAAMNWRMFDAAAAPLGGVVSVAGGESINGLAVAADGRIALMSSESSGGTQPARTATLRLRHFASDGTLTAGPIVIEEDTPSTSTSLSAQGLTVASDGNTVVNWTRDDGTTTGVLRRYSAAGATAGSDILLPGTVPSLAADNAGHLFVVHYPGTGDPRLERLSLDGSFEAELALPVGTVAATDLSVSPEGRAAVVITGAMIQRFAADGTIDGAAVPFLDHQLRGEGLTTLSIDSAGSVLASIRRNDGWPDQKSQSRVRRFCDTDDAACDRCPEFDESMDSDSDTIPDGCDPCTVLDDGQFASRARTYVTFWGTGGKASKNQMNLIQEFRLPPPVTFASIPAAQDGIRVRVELPDGTGYWDDTLPGGAYGGMGTRGWIVKPTKLTYMDTTLAAIHGIRKVSIQDRSSRAPGTVRVRVFGFGNYYPYGMEPNRTIMLLGDGEASILGACSQAEFTLEDCENGKCRY
jgi:hypothetical protein